MEIKNSTLAILGAKIIDGTGNTPLDNSVIILENDKIKSIGEKGEIDIPKNAKKISAEGKTIIPGLPIRRSQMR